MILIFHLSKYFLKNLKIIFKINYARRLTCRSSRRRPSSQTTQTIYWGNICKKMAYVILFGYKGLAVISQDFYVSFAFDSSFGILLQSNASFESYLTNPPF